MDYDPESDDEVQRLLGLLTEKVEFRNQTGKYWRKDDVKRIALEAEIQKLDLDLQQARQLAGEWRQAILDNVESQQRSARSSMSISCPQSPLTPPPSSRPASPHAAALMLPEAVNAEESAVDPNPPECSPSASSDPSAVNGGGDEQVSLNTSTTEPVNLRNAEVQGADYNTTTFQGGYDAGGRNIVERYMTVSNQIRTMNNNYDAAERAKASATSQPYTSELNRALGTPPKPRQNWTSAWNPPMNYYTDVPSNSGMNFDSHMLDMGHGSQVDHHTPMDIEPCAETGMTRNMGLRGKLYPDPSRMATGTGAASATLHMSSSSLHHPSSTPDGRHSEASKHIHALRGMVNMNGYPLQNSSDLYAFGEDQGGEHHGADLNTHTVRAETVAHLPPGVKAEKILKSRSASREESGREKRRRQQAPVLTGGRHIPTDFTKEGEEQYKRDHFNWCTYDNDITDRNAYLDVLKDSKFRHNVDVANQRPSAFDKDKIFKQHEGGKPFERLSDQDQAILNARGRVAIQHFIEETAKAETLAAKAQASGKKQPPAPRLWPNWVKKLALANATYLPEAATTSIEVSLEFLTLKDRRIGCRYHINDRFVRGPRDGPPTHKARADSGVQDLHGIAHDGADDDSMRVPGHAHCGCSLLDALLDWYLYKTRGAMSTNEDPEMGLKGKVFYQFTSIHPTPRAYYHATFTALTGLDGESDDLYTGTEGWGSEPGVWKTAEYDFKFDMALLEHTFKRMGVDPRVLFASPKPEESVSG